MFRKIIIGVGALPPLAPRPLPSPRPRPAQRPSTITVTMDGGPPSASTVHR